MALLLLALGSLTAQGYVTAAPGPLRTRLARAHASPAAVRMDEAEWVGGEALSASCKDPETVFGIEKIMSILPHRYPFLLVDKVIAFEPGKRCVAIKKVTVNEEFFNGHFPNRPIMPGVLQVEAMAQVGGLVALQPPISEAGGGKGDFFFAGVDNVKWRRPVVPGDTLVMEVRAAAALKVDLARAARWRQHSRGCAPLPDSQRGIPRAQMELKAFKERFGIVKMAGKAYVDGKVALEGEFTFALVKPK